MSSSAAAAFSCDTGGLDQSSCTIDSPKDITNEVITDSNTDIVIESGGRLYTDHKNKTSSNDAQFDLTDGDFIVKAGGAVHANINISAYNVKVEKGGVIDSSGLGWQAAASGTSSCKFGTSPDGFCLGGGPAGGSGGDGNSNTGAAGAGYGGKGGSYIDSSTSYTATGGGRGSVNNETYGNPENPVAFGSGGGVEGSGGETIVGIESTDGHGLASNYGGFPDLQRLVNNATDGDGDTDDPDDDPVDGDKWISTSVEYRKNNPNSILMGSGGGRIKLVGSNKINISGSVLSNGLDAGGTANSGYPHGAGSGGSILISAGGVFGNGTIKAEGGSYSEWLDGDDANTGSAGVSGGGGGGRIYYEYSIAEKNWTVTAERGIGNVNSSKGFAKNTNNQDSGERDKHSTDGTVRSQIAFSANVNQTIINPSGPMKVNGTASSTVKVYINGSKVGETDPRSSDGYYNLTVNGLDINKTSDLGNYTMGVSSTISGNTITENFQISHRNILVDQSSDYILKPGKQFEVSSFLELVKENGAGGAQTSNYSNESATFSVFSSNSQISSATVQTNSTGGFNLTESIPTTTGKKYYKTETENDKGITGFGRKNLSWMKINDSIVDPGQYILINGTSYNPVNIYLENQTGQRELKATATPNSNGYFTYSLKSLQIQNETNLGNYTLTAETSLNGEIRSEGFEISHREIEIDNNPDFLLKPDENLKFSDFADLIKQDGSGGTQRADYSNQNITFNYFNQSQNLNSTTLTTNSTGGFSVFQNLIPDTGLKRFTLETDNQNGIDDSVQDDDIYNINNRSVAWIGINDSIVDPGTQIKVNGTAYNKVNISFNGTEVTGSPVKPGSNTGYFKNTFKVPEISNTSGLGNQTLRINTLLNGKKRSEAFNISIRGIRFNPDNSYPRRINPDQNFTVTGTATKYVENSSGVVEPVNYSNEQIKIVYRDENGVIQTKTGTTNNTGGFKLQDFQSPLNAGDRQIRITTENSESVKRSREETVKTRIRVENSSTTSPSKRLYKDSNLDRTRFINPEQDVDFSVKTRKSLDFVKRVYANVTLPDSSQKQVELNAKGVLGKRLDSKSEWDSSKTSHLTHRNSLGALQADRLRLGYEPKNSDKLILSLPMETGSGDVKDTSGRNNDASVSGTVNRLKSGVFSTNSTELAGGNLRINNQSALNLASNFTITAWVKTTDTGAIYSRASNNEANITSEIRIDSNGEALIQIANRGTGTTSSSSTAVNDGKWHQITGRYNKTHLSIYVDGKEETVSSVNSEITKFQRDPVIGDSGTFNDRVLTGKIDNLRTYNKSLSKSKISDIGSRKGAIKTNTITTDKKVKDILKLLNFKGGLNNQEISVTVFSDPDSDSNFEENSSVINLSQGTDIRSVKGLKNQSKNFRLEFNFTTENASYSPLLDSIDFKARKNPKIKWKNSKSIKKYFNEQYGTYKIEYGAEDYGGNRQDSLLEKSNFTVREIVIKANHTEKKDPGDNLQINGNATLITGDGNGGKSKQNFTGKLNIIYNNTIRGSNRINESLLFNEVSTGSSGEVLVNGSQSPQNTQVTFYGEYSGTDETLVWKNYTDWDSFQTRTGTTHSQKLDSKLSNKTLTLGYASQDLGGSALESYYTIDDSNYPLTDSMRKQDFSKNGSPALSQKGILSTESVKLSGKEGFTAPSPFTKQGSFTINAWVKPESLPTSSGHLGTGTGDPYTVFAVKDKLTLQIVDGGNVYAEAKVNGNSYSTKTTSNNIEAGKWNMISLVYNTGDDSFSVSTGQGGDSNQTTITTTPNLTSKEAFIGYRSDVDANSFKGKIDELRIYSRDAIPFNLRNLAGDKSEQQKITTGKKSFSETVKPGSLVLEADIEKNGQPARVTVQSNAGGTSDAIKLQDGFNRYQITGSMAEAKKYSLKLELDSNVTNAAKIKDLTLIRRYATENPEIDLDGDNQAEANFTGRILEAENKTVNLENLTPGVNQLNFSSKNGVFDARINYTEKLVKNNYNPVNLNSAGEFSTNFTVPDISGSSTLNYYTTSDEGIQGITNTTVISSLIFTNSSVQDLENGDQTVDPANKFQINASIGPHTNDIDRMWAIIKTPAGKIHERNFSKYQDWRLNESVPTIFDQEGNYTAKLKVRDTEGLRELRSPKLSFKVTNGTISSRPVDPTVGLNRKFTIEGVVRQNLSNERVNASVNVTLENTGETKQITTNNSGEYSATLNSPSQKGNYTVSVNSEDKDNITASNQTVIEVKDSTSLNLQVPSTVPASNVGTEEGQNKTFKLNITNTGGTDARNIKVFSIDLPTVDGDKWISLNKTYNVSSGSKKEVEAETWIKAGAPFGTYDSMSLVAKFNESDGTTKNSTLGYAVKVKPNKRPLWQSNRTVMKNEGFSGSLLSPQNPLVMKNTGTSKATNVSWSLTDSRIKEWTKSYNPRQDPQRRDVFRRNLESGVNLTIKNMTVNIPNGTAPGIYSTLLESDSDSPTKTNTANVTVEVPNKPTYKLSFSDLKDDVIIPEGEINMSNPINAGVMATGNTEKILDLELINSGNRDLKWEVSREYNTERRILFDKSDSGNSEEGTEIRESNITLDNKQNYTYNVPDRITPVYYSVSSNADSETYRANVTISCKYPIGESKLCNSPDKSLDSKFIKRNGEIILPLKGKIEDPGPEFTKLDITPNMTGVGDSVAVTAIVKDNKQRYLANNNPINATIKKNLDGPTVLEKKTDINIDGNDVSFDFTPTREFDEGTADNQEPDDYCISFTVEDSSGQTTTSGCRKFTVQESASPEIDRDKTSITLDNVTANSGDSAYITGKITGGNVTASQLNISFSTGSPSKFSFSSSKVQKGAVKAGKNKSFNVTLNSVENLDPLKTFTLFMTTEWVDPDGSSRQPDYETQTKEADINIQANKKAKVSHGSSSSVTVPHNSTRSEAFKITSGGNRKISNVQISRVQSGSDIFISGFNRSGFDLGSGETASISYNITADNFVSPQTVARDIKITYDSGEKYLNDTVISVPEQKAIETSPNNISAAIPINQGDVNISAIETRNIGNVDLTLEFNSNDTAADVYFGSSKTNKYTTTISPGNTDSVNAKSDTGSLKIGKHFYKIRPQLSSGSLDVKDPVDLTLFAQDIGFKLKNQNKTTDIISGDKIEAEFNLTQKDKPINDSETVDIKLLSSGSTFDIPETYSSSSNTWISSFQAPDVQDGINHSFQFKVTSSAFRSELSNSLEVSYKDITPPKFTNLTAEPVESNQNSTIEVKLSDKSNIKGESATAYIIEPNGTTEQVSLQPQTSERLSNTEYKKWKGKFESTQQKGLYNVTVVATDSAENEDSSKPEFFRVFEPLSVDGEAGQPSNSTNIKLIDQGQVLDTVEPENSTYNSTVKSGTYEKARMEVSSRKVATLENFSADRISQDPPKFDSQVSSKKVNVDPEYLTGYAVVSSTFKSVSGQTAIDYSDYLNQIDYQGNLQVMKCEDYKINEATPCQSGYETISKNETVINTQSDTVFVNEIDGFSSYLLVENESSSESTNLNVDLTGDIGNLSDLSNLDQILQQIQDNTEGISSGGEGGGQQFEPSQPEIPDNLDETLENLTNQLNQSEDRDLAVGNNEISLTSKPGQNKTTSISIKNSESVQKTVEFEPTSNLEDITEIPEEVILDPGEFRTVKINVDLRNVSQLKEISGFIQILSNDTTRSVPFSVNVVGAENRLLDLSLEPTLNSFNPGKTARLKLSFSNQGFSRAVDAETTVKIVDITDNEVVAKKTHTYAVQTTLDKVVSLEIPEDTDLGTYEARASVEYSNIPGNRSAKAVGQVEVQRPFWERKTVGLANIYWLGIFLLLIVAGLGGGYWYYRKKKLEAKRSRFEEQVDNEAIPDESGRTAFVGKLSEIGTRAFINLDDLKTHCLTAGATGAGKSVAAQVIVEEALEQDVNVIVLDPTGQWSGYLQENDDKQMEDFYSDFGMSESEERDYRGNIRAVEADQDTIDITKSLRPDEDEGSIHVYSMHKLDNAELDKYVADTIRQIFEYNPEEKDDLKTLVVYDEAHRVLEKFGGEGEGVIQLERGAREFRKWGIGMVLISQVIGDFPDEVRANIGTQIQMRTEYEGDLDRIQRKYGDHISQGVTKSSTGTGMVQNSSYNHGRPYFVDFRPLKHSPERISDEQLDKFEKYNQRVDEIEDLIEILDDMGEDVFDYRSRLDLAKKNIRKMSFNLADTYLEELRGELEDKLDM